MRFRILTGAGGLAAGALGLAACGGGVFDPAPGFSQALVTAGYVAPASVHCPKAVDAAVGVSFHCRFTNPDGTRYDALATVTGVSGGAVSYHIVIDRQLGRAGFSPPEPPARTPPGNGPLDQVLRSL